MSLAFALLAALLVQFALQSVHVWWVLAACQPLLLVVVASSRRLAPVSVGWLGLGLGLASDAIADRIIGPGGIAGVVAGLVVALTVRRFELEGPLFWIVSSLLAASCSELALTLLVATLGATPDHRWLGSLAVLATTGTAGLAVAAADRVWRWWRSPERQRRRVLKHL